MSDEFEDVGTTDPDAFGKLAPSRRNWLRKRRLWEAEWVVRETEYGGLVAQLRERAKSALRLSWLMLVVLCLIGAAGLGWLVADVMGWLTSDAEQAERRVLVANADARLAELNADKKALDEEFQTLRDKLTKVIPAKFGVVNFSTSRTLNDLRFGPNGEAIAVGQQGLIVTRAAGSPAWQDASLPGEDGTLFALRFGPNGEAVAVGEGGLIVTRAAGSPAWQDASLLGEDRYLTDLRFGPNGEAVAVGWGGLILTRAAGSPAWQDASLPGEGRDLIALRFGPNGEAVVVGSGGLIVTRAAGATAWLDHSLPGRGHYLTDLRFAPNGEAVAVGWGGLIVTRAAGSPAWQDASLPGEGRSLYDLIFGPDGEAVAVGEGGLIVTRAAGTSAWQEASLPGEVRTLLDLRFGPNGEAVAVGDVGLIVSRAAGSPAWLGASLPAERRSLSELRFGPNGEAVAVGQDGLIVTRGNENALQVVSRAASNADLRVALRAAPQYPETQSWLTALSSLQDRRAPLSIKIAATEQDKEAAAKGTLTAETRLAQMATFLTDCAASSTRDGASEATITACTAAYEAALADKENAFFEYLAQRLTPLALLIFLLGTLGGAYRYNARLAGFYHARADALEAAALSQGEDRLERLTTAFASEKMPFKDARLPIDTAADFAKSAMGKVRGGAG